MQIINIHNTESEALEGTIYPLVKVNFNDFVNIVRKSFIEFHKSDSYNDGDYLIEDFIDYHNENNEIKIDWCVGDYIQLSEKEINYKPKNDCENDNETICSECGSCNIETYFDCDDSVNGESRHRCRDCENIW